MYFGHVGLLNNITESLFTYFAFMDIGNFSKPSYQPLFDLLPNETISEMCSGNFFCIYDTFVTGNISFGQATLSTVMEISRTMELVAPGEGRGEERARGEREVVEGKK